MKSKKRSYSLADSKSVPKENLGDYTILLYGAKKIGKTSFAAQFPNAQFLMCEPGGKALRIHQNAIKTWLDLKGYVKALEDSDVGETVVIDTIDIAYDLCFDYICKRDGFSHPQDMNDYGKSWRKISKEFMGVINRILNLGRGIIFISHETEREVTLLGQTSGRIGPSMPKQARETLEAVVDIWAYYGYDSEGKRTILIDEHEGISAGCRLEENFNYTNGERVTMIDAGSRSSETYNNFIVAFNNELEMPEPEPEPVPAVKPRLKKKVKTKA